jgi:SAM-dependent methyltransferase
MTPTPYDQSFYESQAEGSRRSAKIVIGHVAPLFKVTSVVDVGCGVGTWIAEWLSRGVTDAIGVDGEYVNTSALHVPPEHFRPADLSRPLDLGRKFDLVQSLEVAEHIEERYADQFVSSLVRHGDTILFSAAIPHQGGTSHVNEQWPSYWIEKFQAHGYEPYDVIRPTIWYNPDVAWWYRQNVLLLAKGRDFGPRGALNLVHPALLEVNSSPTTRRLVSLFPGAVVTSVRNRLRRR